MLQLADTISQLLHFRVADNRPFRIHGCRTSLAQEPAPPIKRLGPTPWRRAVEDTVSPGSKLCSIIVSFCSVVHRPAADITRQQFNVSILVRHKPVLEPFCLCRLSGRNGASSQRIRSFAAAPAALVKKKPALRRVLIWFLAGAWLRLSGDCYAGSFLFAAHPWGYERAAVRAYRTRFRASILGRTVFWEKPEPVRKDTNIGYA